MTNPRFSVITPSLNYGRFLTDTINSVINQKDCEIEHVVIDGGSTDNTLEVLSRFDDVSWVSENDRGQSDALNKGLALSRGEFIGWLNADEFYLDGAIQQAAQAFEDGADVVYGDAMFISEDNLTIRLRANHSFDPYVLRHCGPYIPSCSFFVRRSCLRQDPWDINLKLLMDWDLYLQLSLHRLNAAYIPRPLGAYRVHPNQVTNTSRANLQFERERVRLRYNINSSGVHKIASRHLARANRISRKFFNLAYVRELVALRRSGSDARWWQSE